MGVYIKEPESRGYDPIDQSRYVSYAYWYREDSADALEIFDSFFLGKRNPSDVVAMVLTREEVMVTTFEIVTFLYRGAPWFRLLRVDHGILWERDLDRVAFQPISSCHILDGTDRTVLTLEAEGQSQQLWKHDQVNMHCRMDVKY